MGFFSFLVSTPKVELTEEEKIQEAVRKAKERLEQLKRLEELVEENRVLESKIEAKAKIVKAKDVKAAEKTHDHDHNVDDIHTPNVIPTEVKRRAIELDGGLEGGKRKGLSAKEAFRQAINEWNRIAPKGQELVWQGS